MDRSFLVLFFKKELPVYPDSAPHRAAARSSASRASTHSSVPLAKLSFFQNGARVFEPVDQEGAGFQCILAMGRGGEDQDDGLARGHRADAVDQGAAEQAPAAFGFEADGSEGVLGHAGVVLERHRGDAPALGHVAHGADEAGDAADIEAAGDQGGDVGADVDYLVLDPDGGHFSPL